MSKRKHSDKYILDHYECEGQMELEDICFSDLEIFSPCNDCFRDNCVGCKYSCPEEFEAWEELQNCLNDVRW